MKKLILSLCLFTNIAPADTIFGIYAGVQTWFYDSSGDLTADNINFDAFENIDENSENSNSIYIAIEHGVPLIPNIKLRHTNFEINDFVDLTAVICPSIFPNVCFPNTSIDLSHTDLTLYYELLDNWVNLDLGVSAIYFNGKVDFDTGLDADIEYSEFVPALYGKAMIEFPITDLSASLTANIGEFSDITIADIELAIQYKIALGFAIEAGIRQHSLDLDGFTGTNIHSSAIGVFAGLNFHF